MSTSDTKGPEIIEEKLQNRLISFGFQILSGGDLTAKLLPFREHKHEKAMTQRLDMSYLPARSARLSFRKERHKFPTDDQLREPDNRARALHFFANHELLAIELMALALVRFSESHPAMAREILATLSEEQNHLRLYIDRMKDFGLELGDLPLNRYIWDCLSSMRSLEHYAANMSLTFEQANLDYMQYYRGVFTKHQDPKSAEVFKLIHDDEIRHVRCGLTYLERQGGKASLWHTHEANLIAPVHMGRAKGPRFYLESRMTAKFPSEYLERLRRFSHSRGRRPDVYWFAGHFERNGSEYDEGRSERPLLDWELVPIFLASQDDIVVVRREPSPAYRDHLYDYADQWPRIVTSPVERGPMDELCTRVNAAEVKPWAKASQHHWSCKGAFHRYRIKHLDRAGLRPEWFRIGLGKELTDHCAHLAREGFTQVILKPLYSSAGRGALRPYLPLAGNLPETPFLAEPLLERICDYSSVFTIFSAQHWKIELTRFYTDDQGRYLGHCLAGLGPFPEGSEAQLSSSLEQIKHSAQQLVSQLAKDGFRGPGSIDHLVYKDPSSGTLKPYPCVEFNPRFSMGHVALGIKRRFSARRPRAWHIQHKSRATGRFPYSLEDGKQRFFTNDPTSAQRFLGYVEFD